MSIVCCVYMNIYVRRHVQIYFVCFLINPSLITNRMCWNCMQTYRLDHLGSLHIVWGIRGYVIIVNTLSLALTLSMYIYIYVYPGGLRPDLRGQHAASRYICYHICMYMSYYIGRPAEIHLGRLYCTSGFLGAWKILSWVVGAMRPHFWKT